MNDETFRQTAQPSPDGSPDAGIEHSECSRRGFLDKALPIAAAVTAATCLPSVAFGRRRNSRDVLMVVFLRGGLDGLNACVPYGDPNYYKARPKIGIPPPGTSDGVIDLDGYFGMAPSLAPLLQPYQDKKLAFVQATGSTDPSRSHFDSEKHMELGLPEMPARGIGWLSRHLLNVAPLMDHNPLRAAALDQEMPYTLVGAPSSLPVNDLSSFKFVGNPSTADLRKHLIKRSFEHTIEPLSQGALDSIASFALLEQVDFGGYVPDNGAIYPATKFGRGLKNCSALIKAGLGTEALMLEIDEFDTHTSQAGPLAKLLKNLADGMNAFYLDNLSNIDNITMVVMSEFGRRVEENTARGTDHGHGNIMLAMGGHVAGGQVLTHWPTLDPSALDDGDLQVTIDYRDILSEILVKRLECTRPDLVFPNFTPNFQGIII